MTEEDGELDQALLDGVDVSRLQELTEDVSAGHDLVGVPALADLSLAEREQTEGELTLRILQDVLQAGRGE